MVATTGVLVAAAYYIQNLRTNEKIRRRDMVFQKTNVNTYQFYDIMFDVARMTDWDTLEEFERKYGYFTSPEVWKKFIYLMSHFNCLGILLRDGFVDANQIFQLYSAGFIMRMCKTFKPWIDVQGTHDRAREKKMVAKSIRKSPFIIIIMHAINYLLIFTQVIMWFTGYQ
jgi:hypothetical protein